MIWIMIPRRKAAESKEGLWTLDCKVPVEQWEVINQQNENLLLALHSWYFSSIYFGYHVYLDTISENLGNSFCSSHISDNFFERKYHHYDLAPKSSVWHIIITFSSGDINVPKYAKILLKTSFYSSPTYSYK